MSFRRQNRGRTHPSPVLGTEQSSIVPNMSSSRIERTTRLNSRYDSLPQSGTPQSFSSEEIEGFERTEPETRQTRRQKLQQSTQYVRSKKDDEEAIEDEDGDEEEITRCICRKQEYPGPPVPLNDGNGRSHAAKDNYMTVLGLDAENLPEDAGSLFIQCDDCKVWQHGGCVGILDEAMSPDNYYCEECRKDLHKFMTGARGQRYSRYLPVYDAVNGKAARTPSISKDSGSRSSKEADGKLGPSAAGISSAKRRLTMNSRAALDEEEAIRKAIEESKSDGSVITATGIRKGKRPRDSGEDTRQDLKRRKTGGSESETLSNINTASIVDSDNDQSNLRERSGTNRRNRTSGGQTQRDRELREREKEKEREREEAARRRHGRADRRRVEDESEPPEDNSTSQLNGRTGASSRTTKQQASKNTISATNGIGAAVALKRSTRAPTTRKGKAARTQNTKDRENIEDGDSPVQSHSRDSDDAVDVGSTLLPNGSKPSKVKQFPQKTSINDLRKRAAGILEYISRTQVEMASDKTPSSSSGATPTMTPPILPVPSRPAYPRSVSASGGSKLSKEITPEIHDIVDGDARRPEEKTTTATSEHGIKSPTSKMIYKVSDANEFTGLNSLQMMDVLTRELVLWQKDFGKYGDKG